jgi:hypothetical protein
MEVLERRSAAYHRAAAARARRLLAEATTPWVKEQLAEAMERHDHIAAEIDRASEPDGIRHPHTARPMQCQAKPPADNPRGDDIKSQTNRVSVSYVCYASLENHNPPRPNNK